MARLIILSPVITKASKFFLLLAWVSPLVLLVSESVLLPWYDGSCEVEWRGNCRLEVWLSSSDESFNIQHYSTERY